MVEARVPPCALRVDSPWFCEERHKRMLCIAWASCCCTRLSRRTIVVRCHSAEARETSTKSSPGNAHCTQIVNRILAAWVHIRMPYAARRRARFTARLKRSNITPPQSTSFVQDESPSIRESSDTYLRSRDMVRCSRTQRRSDFSVETWMERRISLAMPHQSPQYQSRGSLYTFRLLLRLIPNAASTFLIKSRILPAGTGA
jgi:hypothetical protein